MSSWLFEVTREGAENRLYASEKKRRIYLEQTPVAVIECDDNERIIGWNPAAEKIFGYSAAEMMGMKPFQFLVPEPLQQAVSDMWHRMLSADEAIDRTTIQNYTKSGSVVFCDWYSTALTGDYGQIIGYHLYGDGCH